MEGIEDFKIDSEVSTNNNSNKARTDTLLDTVTAYHRGLRSQIESKIWLYGFKARILAF